MRPSIPRKYYGSYHQSDIVSDFKTTQRCLTGNITLQCGLSAGKNFSVVEQYAGYNGNLAHAHTECVRLFFLLPSTRAWE